ncbi:hypothetical protein FKP32DRAFT_1583899 [Trametes sanguinea]|nr:hypothetical protein FKP32DRAFT_1583899 [Trametes sanguinea]
MQNQIEQAIRIALQSSAQRRNFALALDGARVIPRLTSPNDTLRVSAGSSPENALEESFAHRPFCWSFPGNRGQIGIRLSQKIIPTHLVLDMAYSTASERPSRAPRQVILWGVVDGHANHATYEKDLREYRSGVAQHGSGPAESTGYTFLALAAFEYDATAAFPLQTYRVAESVVDSEMEFGVIVVEIRGNWGGDQTAICGLRVHGELV